MVWQGFAFGSGISAFAAFGIRNSRKRWPGAVGARLMQAARRPTLFHFASKVSPLTGRLSVLRFGAMAEEFTEVSDEVSNRFNSGLDHKRSYFFSKRKQCQAA